MDRSRGILFLSGPLNGVSATQKLNRNTNSMTLIFDENGRYLSLAQEALWRVRQRYEWVCVAAEGSYACVAVALAAQLPVDRLALTGSELFLSRKDGLPREIARLESYARRNLSLVVSEILLIGAQDAEVRGFLWGRNRGRLCALDGNDRKDRQVLLTANWDQVCRNNLLIP